MDDKTITFEYALSLLLRNAVGFVISILICAELAILANAYLPKKYKSKAVLNIQSSYFKNPLVSDLISEINDPSEGNAQRQSLLRLSLSEPFLDTLGERYRHFTTGPESEIRSLEREVLLHRIEYFSLSSTSFQISIGASDPYEAYNMTKDVLEQMTYTLIEERYQKLVRAKDAIQAQAQFLDRALKDGQSASQSRYLQDELGKINSSIASLRSKYTESHPELFKLRQEAQSIRARMKRTPAPSGSDDVAEAFVIPNSKAPIQDIYNDILKKLSHLNIVLRMENDRDNVSYLAVIEHPSLPTTPIFPNPTLTLAGGLAAGVVLGILQMVFFEIRRMSFYTPELAAQSMQVPFLGELPSYVGNQGGLMLIEGGRAPKALPMATT